MEFDDSLIYVGVALAISVAGWFWLRSKKADDWNDYVSLFIAGFSVASMSFGSLLERIGMALFALIGMFLMWFGVYMRDLKAAENKKVSGYKRRKRHGA